MPRANQYTRLVNPIIPKSRLGTPSTSNPTTPTPSTTTKKSNKKRPQPSSPPISTTGKSHKKRARPSSPPLRPTTVRRTGRLRRARDQETGEFVAPASPPPFEHLNGEGYQPFRPSSSPKITEIEKGNVISPERRVEVIVRGKVVGQMTWAMWREQKGWPVTLELHPSEIEFDDGLSASSGSDSGSEGEEQREPQLAAWIDDAGGTTYRAITPPVDYALLRREEEHSNWAIFSSDITYSCNDDNDVFDPDPLGLEKGKETDWESPVQKGLREQRGGRGSWSGLHLERRWKGMPGVEKGKWGRVVRKPLSPRSGEYKQLWDGVNEEIKKTRGAGWKLRDDVEGKDFESQLQPLNTCLPNFVTHSLNRTTPTRHVRNRRDSTHSATSSGEPFMIENHSTDFSKDIFLNKEDGALEFKMMDLEGDKENGR